MSWDITDTDNYYRTAEGRLVADILISDLAGLQDKDVAGPDPDETDHLAIGYPFPLISEGVCPPVFMLSETGVLSWAGEAGVITACIDSVSWPCATEMFKRIFISHALEHVADQSAFLAEVWRSLKGEGEVVLVVPHRRSLWARADKTPFGQGTPFSRRQLKLALDQAGFDQITIKHSLYMPPFGHRLPLAMRRRLHYVGRVGWAVFGGVLLVRAKKRLYSAYQQPSHALRRKVRQFMVRQPAGAVTPLRRDRTGL